MKNARLELKLIANSAATEEATEAPPPSQSVRSATADAPPASEDAPTGDAPAVEAVAGEGEPPTLTVGSQEAVQEALQVPELSPSMSV